MEAQESFNKGCIAYTFTPNEKEILISALVLAINGFEKQITKIDKNPKNEGQASFWQKKRELQGDLDQSNFMLDVFSFKKPIHIY